MLQTENRAKGNNYTEQHKAFRRWAALVAAEKARQADKKRKSAVTSKGGRKVSDE